MVCQLACFIDLDKPPAKKPRKAEQAKGPTKDEETKDTKHEAWQRAKQQPWQRDVCTKLGRRINEHGRSANASANPQMSYVKMMIHDWR